MGTPVQVVNKPGAGQQVGITEAARSKPDGYSMVYANVVSVITSYLDPQRKAAYSRKELQSLAIHVPDPAAIAVKADGPFKDMKVMASAEHKAKMDEQALFMNYMGPQQMDAYWRSTRSSSSRSSSWPSRGNRERGHTSPHYSRTRLADNAG